MRSSTDGTPKEATPSLPPALVVGPEFQAPAVATSAAGMPALDQVASAVVAAEFNETDSGMLIEFISVVGQAVCNCLFVVFARRRPYQQPMGAYVRCCWRGAVKEVKRQARHHDIAI